MRGSPHIGGAGSLIRPGESALVDLDPAAPVVVR